jgi:hypothetical protein
MHGKTFCKGALFVVRPEQPVVRRYLRARRSCRPEHNRRLAIAPADATPSAAASPHTAGRTPRLRHAHARSAMTAQFSNSGCGGEESNLPLRGETMDVAARPARSKVKVLLLMKLKAMIG